uniref:Uncharacterized protein n=1 Tax=Spumella elongata TaxID=89044 RepID=A0A7S3HSH9_9STRA
MCLTLLGASAAICLLVLPLVDLPTEGGAAFAGLPAAAAAAAQRAPRPSTASQRLRGRAVATSNGLALRAAPEDERGRGRGLPDGSFEGAEFGELANSPEGNELPFALDASALAVIFFAAVACLIALCLQNDASLSSGGSVRYVDY